MQNVGAMRALIQQYGIPLVALNVLVEQLGAPIPAMPTLAVAGALARDGELSGGLLVLVAVAAAVTADSVWFAVGRRYGDAALRFVCKISLSPDACVRRTESFFTRRGARTLLVAKFIPGFAAVATPLAGASGMPLHTFLLFDTAGAILWAGSAIALGALLHRQIEKAIAALESLGAGALVLAAGLLALYVAWRIWERRRFTRAFASARIEPDELARRLTGQHPPHVFDVRSSAARCRDPRAIPGARRLDVDPVEDDLADLPVEREIVLYCT